MSEGKRVLRQAFKRLDQEVPERLSRVFRWLRHPASRLVRIPVGILFVIGGVFSILPGLGIWMLPLGLLLIAYDVPFLRRPVARFTIWGAERWAMARRWLSQRWEAKLRRAQLEPRGGGNQHSAFPERGPSSHVVQKHAVPKHDNAGPSF